MKTNFVLFLALIVSSFFAQAHKVESFIDVSKDMIRLELQKDFSVAVESISKFEIISLGQDVAVQSDVVVLNSINDTKESLICSVLFVHVVEQDSLKPQKVDCQ